MSITTEEKKKYFAETALALSRAGFHVEEIPDNKLGVWLDEQPLCEVGELFNKPAVQKGRRLKYR